MDKQSLQEALGVSAARVLEEAAFIFTETAPVPFIASDWPGPVVRAELPFTGPVHGRFALAAPASLCVQLAQDMLGAEDGDPEAEENSEDVLREMVNMLAGMTLEQVVPDLDMWELSVPVTKHMPAIEYVDIPRADIEVILSTEEEEPIEVAIYLTDGPD